MSMDETGREELKETYRKEKDPRVATRMLAVHTVYVRKAGIDETAAHLMRSARWVRNWLHRYDEGGLDGLRDLPRSGRPRRIPRETIEQIVNKTVQLKRTPAGLQKRIHEETGTKLHITYTRKIMCMYDLSPKESQRVHINRAGKKAVQRHDPQLKIKSFSSNSYRSMFPNKQILRGYAENCAILCPSANYESSLRTGNIASKSKFHA